jgi:hypothetical protein
LREVALIKRGYIYFSWSTITVKSNA